VARVNVTYYKRQQTTDWPGGDIRVVSFLSTANGSRCALRPTHAFIMDTPSQCACVRGLVTRHYPLPRLSRLDICLPVT